ncbi:MAG: sialate O-acetylesterase [Prevotella sp.]|nr:sialate O-acetylesterase [Prevotella sp.]
MNIKITKLLFFCLLLTTTSIRAKITLPKFFSDGMVLQRETSANLWGTAKESSVVKITTSWDKKTYVAKSDSNGKWKTSIKTPEAGGPYQITFSDGERTELNNILIGEVWLCSGQSNMEMPMKGYKNQPVENGIIDILHSTDCNLRLFTVKQNSQFAPVDTVRGAWREANPESVREFSATAYYFGRELRQVLDVPVGLIVAAWGGSACEAWMTPEWLQAFPDAKIPQSPEDIPSKNRTPTVLYNGMLHPLIGISMRGVIWYQGEENVNRYPTYADMLTTLIAGWRSEWGEGNFPFYYCQIAPYDYKLIGYTVNSAFLREQQSKAEQMSDNVGMAVLMDAGLEYGIHPRKKSIAGQRLALLALENTYGIKGFKSKSAYYNDVTFKNDTAVVSFERADMWIYGENGYKSDLFEVAGEDKVFHSAKAWIDRSKVYVKCDSVAAPVAVRYAFSDWAQGDLFCDGLPVSSFRTDDWDE